MKLLNKLLNIYIFLLVLFIIIYLLSYFFKPLIYNANTKGKELKDFEDYRYIQDSMAQYISYYRENNIQALKQSTAFIKRKKDLQYQHICENYIKNNYRNLQIVDVTKSFNDVYIVEYSINIDYNVDTLENIDKQKIIMKINKIEENFQIFYDSLLDSI